MELIPFDFKDLGINLLPNNSFVNLQYADDLVRLSEDDNRMQSPAYNEKKSSYDWYAIRSC